VTVERLTTPGHHYRCYRPKATERYLLMHKRGVEFVDLRSNNHMRHNWLRAPCRHGFVPCNGLLYMPPHQCFCYPGAKLNGFNALSGHVEDAMPEPAEVGARLVRGIAYDSSPDARHWTPDASWWPTYRHDPQRSGRSPTAVPVELQPMWRWTLGGNVSPPVVAGGKLYVANIDAHAVRCLDAADGTPVWRYTAGGRVDSPPTVHGGLVLFGSTDGWLYCLRAADGALAWRFRAAPRERLVGAFGQLESAWPAHGSVLVQGGLAYVTAGRSSYLDSGIYVYAVEPATGRVVHRARLWSGRPDVTTEPGRPFDMEGTRSDLLVSDGEDLYLFHTRLNPDLSRQPTPRITKLGDRQVSQHLMCNDGFLDKTWFDRSYWVYGRRWPGYYFAYAAPKSGQILVFDEETTYGLHVFRHRRGHSPMFKPGDEGYELFADHNACQPVLRPTEVGREKGTSYARSLLPRWSEFIPLRAVAMVLAGERLYLAGPPDVVPKDDPMAAFEGRKGAALWVVDATTGEKLAERALDCVPTFDGLIAASGRLYLVTTGGEVLCLAGKPS
ncbi:MAG: PQQ-binding-like beta-propeller repeat protein, partial [bacterium]